MSGNFHRRDKVEILDVRTDLQTMLKCVERNRVCTCRCGLHYFGLRALAVICNRKVSEKGTDPANSSTVKDNGRYTLPWKHTNKSLLCLIMEI
jgi:hypothetical protein